MHDLNSIIGQCVLGAGGRERVPLLPIDEHRFLIYQMGAAVDEGLRGGHTVVAAANNRDE